eukprot:3168861-Karenia_brevis.AAC.1
MPEHESELVSVLIHLGFPREEVRSIVDVVCLDVYGIHNKRSHLLQLIASLHSDTWMAVEGYNAVALTTQGAMAGSALADL